MNLKQKKKLVGLTVIIFLLACAAGLLLFALKQNINLFYTPAQLQATRIMPKQALRLGGYVKEHSVNYAENGSSVSFIITDNLADIHVNYQGVLPNLFREGQGVVVTGKLQDTQTLAATEVLAKHDEKYMPPILSKALAAQRG